MNDLARLSAAQRQHLIDGFVTETFAGIDADAPGAGIAAGMRSMPAERCWTLPGVLNGWPAREPAIPAFEWFAAALRSAPVGQSSVQP